MPSGAALSQLPDARISGNEPAGDPTAARGATTITFGTGSDLELCLGLNAGAIRALGLTSRWVLKLGALLNVGLLGECKIAWDLSA